MWFVTVESFSDFKCESICVFSSCFGPRGWRIQWSIVPDISEPLVRNLSPAAAHSEVTSGDLLVYACDITALPPPLFQEPPKEDLTVSEKFQLVLDVAQRAQVRHDGQKLHWSPSAADCMCFDLSSQNLFGKMANILEKIKKWVSDRTDYTEIDIYLYIFKYVNVCLCV